jgi:hypothetical protein
MKLHRLEPAKTNAFPWMNVAPLQKKICFFHGMEATREPMWSMDGSDKSRCVPSMEPTKTSAFHRSNLQKAMRSIDAAYNMDMYAFHSMELPIWNEFHSMEFHIWLSSI